MRPEAARVKRLREIRETGLPWVRAVCSRGRVTCVKCFEETGKGLEEKWNHESISSF